MSLNEEDRNTVVRLQMEKAYLFLEQANEMYKQHYWDIASNRYYYACYHAVQALLIKNGLSCHTHDGLITSFTPIRDKIAISCMLRQIHESSSHAIRHGLYIKNRKRLFCP